MNKISRLILAAMFAVSPCYASTSASRQYNFVDDRNNSIPITASRMDAEFDNAITKLNQKVIISASAPSSPIAGMYWQDSTNKLLKEYRNSEWVIHGAVHVGSTAPTTMQSGDIWVDTSASENVLKFRNKANGAWITAVDSSSTINSVPSGAIFMWSGTIATIPSGYVLCNGSNSTPDLRNLFVVGANADSGGAAKSTITGSAAQTGGSVTISQANLPSYNLSFTRYDGNSSGLTGVQGTTNGANAVTQNVSSGGSGTAYTQPFYALAYIMKT